MDIQKAAFSFLPPGEGYLPKWQLFIAATALGNTIQSFIGIEVNRKMYNAKSGLVTPLSSRTVGIWTLTSSMVRFYAAYHISEKSIYDITMWTYLLAFTHYSLEVLVFKTAKLPGPAIAPFIVSTMTLTWMFLQYDFYVTK